jgi:hypothetical protein
MVFLAYVGLILCSVITGFCCGGILSALSCRRLTDRHYIILAGTCVSGFMSLACLSFLKSAGPESHAHARIVAAVSQALSAWLGFGSERRANR